MTFSSIDIKVAFAPPNLTPPPLKPLMSVLTVAERYITGDTVSQYPRHEAAIRQALLPIQPNALYWGRLRLVPLPPQDPSIIV